MALFNEKDQEIIKYSLHSCIHSLINLLLASIIQIYDNRVHFVGTLTYDDRKYKTTSIENISTGVFEKI